jgi:hypothetical protein
MSDKYLHTNNGKNPNPIHAVSVVADAEKALKEKVLDEHHEDENLKTQMLKQKGVEKIKKAKSQKPLILRRRRGMTEKPGESFIKIVQDAEASYNHNMNLFNRSYDDPDLQIGF